MKAMILDGVHNLIKEDHPLLLANLPIPDIGSDEILINIHVCGVCHTELDEIEGRTPPPIYPVIPGHQVIGKVVEIGADVSKFSEGDRVGVAWIFSACGKCEFCLSDRENLCTNFLATGRDANGGYAEYIKVSQEYAYRIPELFTDSEAAPLLCAGAIGYRSLRLAGIKNGESLGLTGFGGSGHIVLKLVKHQFPNTDMFVFSRTEHEREFALELGASWAGDIGEQPPEMLNAVIETTPVWKPVLDSLHFLKPGGRLVINAIRKEDTDKDYFSSLDYKSHLWMEKEIKSVANVTRRDVFEFLEIASQIPLKPATQEFALEDANHALIELKTRKIHGSKVLICR